MKKAEREKQLRLRLRELQETENELYRQGARYIGGVDEVGRGPLAGPVVAACVVMPPDFDVPGIDDSKKLTPRRRERMAAVIRERATAYGLGQADEKVIDEINILEATKRAMREAVAAARVMLRERCGGSLSWLLIDAVELDGIDCPQRALVKGDSRSLSIAAASILAKVTRDAMMVRMDERYPGYGFAQNKGYGTRAHYQGLRQQGPCPLHRRTFLRRFFAQQGGEKQ
ncbi:MAG: ribonuclease HII [Anaerovoracaceae bacterium]|jgi:ribonuclease HII